MTRKLYNRHKIQKHINKIYHIVYNPKTFNGLKNTQVQMENIIENGKQKLKKKIKNICI